MRVAEIAIRALAGGLVADQVLNGVPDTSLNPGNLRFLARQTGNCLTGEVACAGGCIPIGTICCAPRRAYCKAGNYCMPVSGCCPNGRTCSGLGGTITECGDQRKECDGGCIPKDGTCCNRGTGRYCEAGTYCLPLSGCCRDGQTCSGSGGSGGGGSGGGSSDDDETTTTRRTSTRTTASTTSRVTTGRTIPTLTDSDDSLPSVSVPDFDDFTSTASLPSFTPSSLSAPTLPFVSAPAVSTLARGQASSLPAATGLVLGIAAVAVALLV